MILKFVSIAPENPTTVNNLLLDALDELGHITAAEDVENYVVLEKSEIEEVGATLDELEADLKENSNDYFDALDLQRAKECLALIKANLGADGRVRFVVGG